MVLEFLDRIWSTRRTNADVGLHRRLAIRRALAAVKPKVSRLALEELLHLAAPGADPQPGALQALMRYGKRLQYESEFRLASHVYSMVVDYATHIEDFELLTEAYEHYATCMREQGNARAAMASYAIGLALAVKYRNTRARLRIAIAQSNLHRALGNATEARKALDPLLRRARTLGDPELLTRVLHERGLVAYEVGQHLEALLLYAEAMRNCDDPKNRGRLLNDIALALKALGFVEDARRAWIVSYLASKGDAVAKWAAGVNLLMLAHVRRDEASFDQYRHELARAPMPARLLVAYWLEVGDGSIVFGRLRDAAIAWQHAATHAARYGYRNELSQARRSLAGHREEQRPLPTPRARLPIGAEELRRKVQALSSFRGLLGRAWGGDVNAASAPPLRTTLRRGRPPRLDLA
jgi:tetratricopeptide (TPR) repeat protein